LTNDVWRCLFQALWRPGPSLCSAGKVHVAVSRSESERHQTALRGRALTRSRARTASPATPLSGGNVGRRASETSPCRRTGNARRRARPPRGDGEQPAGAVGIETRVRFWCGWLLVAPVQLVFTRSSGRNSLFHRCGNQCCHKRGRVPSGSIVILRSPPGGQSNRGWGPTCAAARREGSLPQKKSRSAVVVSAPVRPCSSPGRAEGSSWSLSRVFSTPAWSHECKNFLTSNAICLCQR
jgi:hypothetical protein